MTSALAQPSELVLGQYELMARIASGGSGSVFLAKDQRDRSEVVVKFIDAREDALNGWVREMRIALRLTHDSIVRCRTVGFDETLGAWALVYDYADGGSLRRALVQSTGFGPGLARDVLRNVADALAFAHRQGVIHRDVKPENIVKGRVEGHSRWQLTDFGDARFLARGGLAETVVGSLSYMAPETFVGKTTRLSDQYALGVVGLECLRGNIQSRREIRALPPADATLEPLEQLLGQMLSPHPVDRFPSMDVVAHVLGVEHRDLRWFVDDNGCAVCDGDSIHWWNGSDHHRCTATRFSRFVKCTGDGIGALQGHRLVVLDETRRTIYADESPYIPLCFDEHGQGWIARSNELAWITSQGVEASGPWSEAQSFSNHPHFVATCSRRSMAAAHVGGTECTICDAVGDAVIAKRRTLPLPLDTLALVAGTIRLITADERQTVELVLRDGELVEHARIPAPRGHVRYVDDELSLVRFFDTAEFFSAGRDSKGAD